jgi:hypothetical protein
LGKGERMGIGDIIGYLLLFMLGFVLVFKPIWLASLSILISRKFYGATVQEKSPNWKMLIIYIRIVGILALIGITNGLLIDMGITNRNILREIANKIIKLETILIPIAAIVVIFGFLVGLFGIFRPYKFRSYVWTLQKKLGVIPNEKHFHQHIAFWWINSLFLAFASFCLLVVILKHYVKF